MSKMMTRAAFAAGAFAFAAPFGVAPELKEAGAVDQAVKDAIAGFESKFVAFKATTDAGVADAVKKAELKSIENAINEQIATLKKSLDDHAAAVQLKLAFAGGGGSDAERKAVEAFQILTGRASTSAEDLKAYKADLAQYFRNGDQKAVTMQVGQDPAGGYWVTPDVNGRIVKKVYESTPMRQLAAVTTIGTDALEGMIDNGEAEAQWVGEMQTRNQTDTPQIGKWRIPVHEMYSKPTVTQKLLEDAAIDVEAWLGDKVGSKFARTENAAFLNGNGVNKPHGLLQYTTVATDDATRAWGSFEYIATGTDGGWGTTTNGTDKLIDLIFQGKAAYRQNGRFLMSRRTMGSARKLKDGQGNYAYALGMRDGALVETMFGFQVYDGEDMPNFSTTGALAVAFGDFAEAYQIVDRLGVSVIRDNITSPGFVKLNTRKRVGGAAVNFEAVKFLKFATA